MIIAICLFGVMLIAGGLALVLVKESVGWIFVGLGVWPWMMIFWIKNALDEIPVDKKGGLTGLLSEELLLGLNEKTTAKGLVKVLSQTGSGAFVMVRFGITMQLLRLITEDGSITVENVYKTAMQVYKETRSEEITGAVMVVALVQSSPNCEQILNYLKVSLDELYQGVVWFNYLNGIVKDSKKPVRTGGIGRDLAFGFTPTLQRFAINLSARYARSDKRIQQAENYEIMDKMISIFTHTGRQNVALIGDYGSGRSTIVNSFAETLMRADSKVPRSLKYRQVYSLDVSSLISAARDHGELEYLMVSILNEVYSAQNIILCLDNAHLFFEEGPGSVDISNLLTPVLESGNVRMILIMDQQKFLELSAKNPALANALNKINVHPTNYEETMRILMDQVPIFEQQKDVIYTYQSLVTACRLSEQYIHDVEMPGKAKLLLESAAAYAERGLVTPKVVETTVEKSYGVKVKVAEGADEREKLLNLEELIHRRMVDQKEAVAAVSNALRRAGAGVKNRNRPIGTFLFLGPTGVGKTELAKALSEVYFDGEDNIIRLDMNEFVTADDVSRLIRDGASDAMSLTAQVMKQPFAVILLDEIEKAHSSVLTTLLQVLDEGILRDEKNREVSFRDSIIIATSNAGANMIREKVGNGIPINKIKDSLIEELIAAGEFKPEFLNRFDEVCVFKPLSKEDLGQIFDLIIASTNKTLDAQRISVVVEPEAKQILIERGYDPKMGARPMRRVIQKTVENIVAAGILAGAAQPGSVLTITAKDVEGM